MMDARLDKGTSQKGRLRVLMVDALVLNDYSLILCEQLQQLGLDVTLVTTANRQIDMPVSFSVKPWAPSKNPQDGRGAKAVHYMLYLWRLARCGLSRQFDIIHFQFFRLERPEAAFMAFLRIMGVPVVHTAHNVLPHERRVGDIFFRIIIYLSASRVIVHSKAVRQRLMTTFGFLSGKISVIPHGNFDRYRPGMQVSKNSARQRFNLDGGDRVLLFFGFIRPYKGLDILLEAFDIAFRQNASLRLIIAGQCQTKQEEFRYREQISTMSSRSGIIFHPGYVEAERVSDYFAAADWVVLPYLDIDYSGIIHLAYAYGRPIIASEVGGLGDMVKEDHTGITVEPNNSERLAEVIVKAASQTTEQDRMGARGVLLGAEKYNWRHAAVLTRQVYKKVGRRPS